MAKYGGVLQHQLKRFLDTCELIPFSPEKWPQILGQLIYPASGLVGSTSIKRAVFLSFLREIRRLHSLVNHVETALRGAPQTPDLAPRIFMGPDGVDKPPRPQNPLHTTWTPVLSFKIWSMITITV